VIAEAISNACMCRRFHAFNEQERTGRLINSVVCAAHGIGIVFVIKEHLGSPEPIVGTL
jgi:hypothetical protein